jgi:hypothetical protein
MGASFIAAMLFSSAGWAAPEFKIRYNSKFPCLEVMDGKANKITDISEGTKGEVVTSGKSSITLSFLKGSAGQPEVMMTDAKSALSEMELEAFGLSVGMKPAGVVTVRFGSDNKPQFEMDRTGGARFLMADLGNLDTAAGKELASAGPAPGAEAQPPKGLLRFRERLEAWKTSLGKGGWSNRPGKILSCGEDAKVTYLGQPERKLLDGEAVQAGASITAGTSPITLQSGPGIYHQIQPGGRVQIAKLETGQKDVKVTLLEGTLLTQIVTPLVAPRLHVCGIGNGVVIQSSDGLFQVTATGPADRRIAVAEGTVRLVEEAGAAQVAEATAGWSSGNGHFVQAQSGLTGRLSGRHGGGCHQERFLGGRGDRSFRLRGGSFASPQNCRKCCGNSFRSSGSNRPSLRDFRSASGCRSGRRSRGLFQAGLSLAAGGTKSDQLCGADSLDGWKSHLRQRIGFKTRHESQAG